MVENKIKLSDTIGGRLDPHQFHFERMDMIHHIVATNQWCRLKEIVYNVKQTTTELSSEDIYIGLENIESHSGDYIPTKDKVSISSAAIFNKGDILFPKLRPYLNKVYRAEFRGKCSTEFHIFQSKNIDPDFLTIVLRSSFVLKQTKHLMTGNTLPRLQTEDIENLIIPLPQKETQQKIVDLYNQAHQAKQAKEQEAKALLDSIDGYLLKELGIELPKDTATEKYFRVKISDLIGGRLDPMPYNTKSMSLRKSIKDSTLDKLPLKDLIVQSIAGDWGIDDDEVVDDKYTKCLVIRSTEFDNQYNLKLDNSRVKYRNIRTDKLQKMDIKPDDILIEKSGGSPDQPVGRVAFLSQEIAEKNVLGYSNFIHKIRIANSEALSEYVYYFLKTMYNIGITSSMQSQTNGIRNLIMKAYFNQYILLPNKEKQNEIAKNIQAIREKAAQLQTEAQSHFEQTKKEIEKIIIG